MRSPIVVRYTTRPDAADENERLVTAVFAQLAEVAPAGLRYTAIRLDDGVSFVHIALLDDDNPLLALPAWRDFTSGLATRCVDGPTPANGTLIADY